MKVLTFNSHQPYIHLFAAAFPWQVGVIIPKLPSGRLKSWDPRIRPQPGNVRLYPSVAAALEDSEWDWVMTHNLSDLLDCRDVRLPKVFVVHGTMCGRILQDGSAIDQADYLHKMAVVFKAHRCRVVYISELKQRDWGIPGRVIHNAIDPDDYGGYRGDIPGVLQVSNYLKERGAMLGWQAHERVCRDVPGLLLGTNPGLAGSRHTTGWEDLKEQYRSYRVYLYTAIHPYEDGFNLALMEAMATGMPVATMYNPSSPVEDGVEGVVADTAEELREKVLRLLDREDEAFRMGQAACAKLRKTFPLSAFRSGWENFAAELG